MTFRLRKKAVRFVFCFVIASFVSKCAFAMDKRVSMTISHYIMAVMHDDLGEPVKAIKEFKKALSLDYKNTLIHLNLAISYIKNSEFNNAVKELNLTAKLDPAAVEPHAILALLYTLQNKTDESNREYEIALKNASKLQPKNIEVYKNLGILYLQQKKYQAAENMFNLMLGLTPSDAQAHFYLANTFDQQGKKGAAEQELRKALESNPDYHEALNYLGYLYVEENRNLDEAEIMIKKALEMEPDNGAYLDSLGWLYFKKGDIDKSIESLSRAVILFEDPVIYEHLGDAYFKKNDSEKAIANWQNSLKLDPNQESVKNKIGTKK